MRNILIATVCFVQCMVSSCNNVQKDNLKSVDSFPKIDIADKVFFFGPSIDSARAVISAECDCCGSDLLFSKDSSFYLVSYCLESDSYLKGVYQVKGNKLTLIYDPLSINAIHDLSDNDSVYEKEKYETSYNQALKVSAEFSFLKNHLVIKTLGGSESDYAMESKELSKAQFLKNLQVDSGWIKLLSK